ncbi:PREDICTED: CASP-like protein 4B1 [Tarenaya hassleriana]|uniref:CASP-like protein 4B1 n=1 Tax=Tarenaya hassleriana TaxID=28532 RepID=UPI00053CA67A|nr:PREDICTED: CASP-like protein 4B1 [Tarenaya hassleriana]
MSSPEKQNPDEVADVETAATGTAITQRWKREDLIKKGPACLRGLVLLFSLLAFIIMASNKHGPGKNFDEYEEYRYLLAIAILSTLYTAGQTFLHFSKREFFDRRTSTLVDFAGDQIVAYLLISAASASIPLTNRFREGQDNIFSDSSAAAISMAILSFFSLAPSALISGYKLSTQSYI